MAKFDADGPGQDLNFGVPGVFAEATANSPARGPPRTQQVDQIVKTKPLQAGLADSGSEPGATRARSSRNRPLEWPGTIAGLAQGWAGRSPPITPITAHVRSITCYGRSRDELLHALVESEFLSFIPSTRSLNDDRLPGDYQPVDQSGCQGVVHVKEGAPLRGRFVVSTIDQPA